MSIVSSSFVAEAPQKDGRIWVRETHVDQFGLKYFRDYLADQNLDLNAAMAAYAIVVANNLVVGEIAADLAQVLANGSLATVTTNYITTAQAGAAIRAAYQSSTQIQAIMLGDFLSSLTDVQLQSLFSITSGQVTSLRANKLTPAATAAATIRASAGQ